MQKYIKEAPFIGPLVLVGGKEWQTGCDFDFDLITRLKLNSKTTPQKKTSQMDTKVLVLPTAAAYQQPELVFKNAKNWFGSMSADIEECRIFTREDAYSKVFVDQIAAAKFIYIAGGSPLHLRSVLRSSPTFEAIITAWQSGAILAASSAGAMALTDPMIDPRGGAFSVGLGAVTNIAVYPHFSGTMDAKLQRTLALAPRNCAVIALPEQTALIREPEGSWHIEGKNCDLVVIYIASRQIGVEELESLIV